ncbi:DUF3592 domain-containing protein [Saccharomonospora iraqiensis]|uniref:DUF3592 domain-containing protein n=1 Tax=Saccharomonospora iraqiensis TaxID=52698 RepID=UPI00022DF0A7|nr:DUF3592 domain-containing protein [Saccharomonospora iraqiensis]
MPSIEAAVVGCVGAVVLAGCVWRWSVRRGIPARVVRLDPDGSVVVESAGARRLWADHPRGAGEIPALVVGDRVWVGLPRGEATRVPLRYTSMVSVAPLGGYGLFLVFLAVGAPWEQDPVGIGLVPLLGIGALPFVAAGYLVGRIGYRCRGRPVRARVVDARFHARVKAMYQAELEYEIDGHRRRRWGPGAYQCRPRVGRRVRALVDPRNPGVPVTFPVAMSLFAVVFGLLPTLAGSVALTGLYLHATG